MLQQRSIIMTMIQLGKNLTGKNYLWYRAGEIIILGDNMRNNNDDFFNFDEDIRKDLIEQGYKGEQFTSKFEKMSIAMDELIEEAEDDNDSMDKKEFEKEIDL